MKKIYNRVKSKKIIIIYITILLIFIISYPFLYRIIKNYKNYIQNKQYVTDYVNSTYGNNFEIIDLDIGSFKVTIFETASTGYYGYDIFKIKDKNGNEPDFRIKMFKGKIYHNYYNYDRNKYFYESYINKYIQNYLSKDQYIVDILLFDTSQEKYNSYEEIISNKKETKNLQVFISILIYVDNLSIDSKKYTWIDDLYNNMNIANYKKLSLQLNFSTDKTSTKELYIDKYSKISINGNITQDTLSEFLNK